MVEIHLGKGAWHLDTSRALGPAGAFGAVFSGKGEDGFEVAIKRIHMASEEHAGRELQIAAYLLDSGLPHVIPILDAGLDAASRRYYLVMARADMSLQELIDRSAPLGEPEAIEIALSVVAALQEIGSIVHRDLKPGNVLLHHGVWKVADLGLARFVEDATSLNTVKDFLTAPYAAPEQWRGDHVTKTADIYALGCLIHALRTGQPPFQGPERADYARQHLTQVPPDLDGSPAMNRLVTSCLAKNPLVRPTADSVGVQLSRMKNPELRGTSSGVLRKVSGALLKVSEELERKRAEEEAHLMRQQAEAASRRDAASSALEQLVTIWRDLARVIQLEAPNAQVAFEQNGIKIRLASASIIGDLCFPVFESRNSCFAEWDVLAGAFIGATEGYSPTFGRGRRSANLWFASLEDGNVYRWIEAGYMFSPECPDWVRTDSILKNVNPEPFGLAQPYNEFDAPRVDNVNYINRWITLAYNPRPIDGEHLDDFCYRWAEHLAKAVMRKLDRPERLPEEEIRKPIKA